LSAQWEAAGIPFQILEIGNVHLDPATDGILFCGESSLNNDNDYGDGAIPIYRNGQWDTLGVFHGRPQTAVRWGDTLVVGGNFNNINGVPIAAIAGLVNGNWIPFGTLDTYAIYRLKVVAGELYVLGAFGDPSGGPCRGIAKRVGDHWESVGCLTNMGTNVQDLVEHNGSLYITGVVRFGGAAAPKDVAVLSNGDWEALGAGIQGNLGAGRSLAVYQDQLYVSGSIPIGAGPIDGGNAGHGIMRWDGSAFHAVGTGFQGLDGGYTYLVGAAEMIVHDDLLWASGSFSFAGNAPAPGIAFWDGSRWCAPPLGPEPEVNGFKFYHDTLFASCHINLDGVDVNCGVRFTGDHYSDTCSLSTGLQDMIACSTYNLRASRRTDGVVVLLGVPSGSYVVEVVDATGRVIHQERVAAVQGEPVPLHLLGAVSGVLVIKVGEVGSVRLILGL